MSWGSTRLGGGWYAGLAFTRASVRRIPSSWTFTSASRLSVSISGWNTLRGLLPLTCSPPHLCPLPRWGRGEGEGDEGEGDEDTSEGGPRPGDRPRGGRGPVREARALPPGKRLGPRGSGGGTGSPAERSRGSAALRPPPASAWSPAPR